MNKKTTHRPERLRFLCALLAATALIVGAPLLAQAPDDGAPAEGAPAAGSARDTQPEPGEMATFEAPTPETFTLSNGAQVWVFEREQLPMVTLMVSVPHGAGADPEGKHGLAVLTADMLDEGTQARSALEFEDEVDYLGASLSTYASQDDSGVVVQSLRRNLEPTLDLLAELLEQPAFSGEEFKRVKQVALSELLQRADNPRAVASLVGDRAFYGEAHPLAHPSAGYPSSVEPLTVEDTRAFYEARWRPDAATIVAVGDVSAEALKAMLEARLGDWKAEGAAPEVVKAPPVEGAARRLVIVHKEGAPQTVIRLVQPGLALGNEREAEAQLLNTVFGGSFTSRLNQNIREDKGYSYGAGSGFAERRGAGTFIATSPVRADVTGPALGEFLKEFRRLSEGDVEQAEVERARATARADAIKLFESQRSVASVYADLAVNDLPSERPRQTLKEIEALDAAAINAFARELAQPEALTIVLVGDRATITQQLKALEEEGFELPEPELRDAEGRPVE